MIAGSVQDRGGREEWKPVPYPYEYQYIYDYDVPPAAPATSIYLRYPSENPFEVPTVTWRMS